MTEAVRPTVSVFGIIVGGVALLTALIHFWGGPFSPQPSIERTVAEKAAAIRDATVAALRGEEIEDADTGASRWDIDRVLRLAAAVLGGLAIILGVAGAARHEPLRAAGGAAALGISAIAFQFLIIALGALILIAILGTVLDNIGFDF